MKKCSLIVTLTLVVFTGIQAQEDQRQENETYFDRFKDALASSDENETIINENEDSSDDAANLEALNDQSEYDDQSMSSSSYDYDDED